MKIAHVETIVVNTPMIIAGRMLLPEVSGIA